MSATTWSFFRAGEPSHSIGTRIGVSLLTECGISFHASTAREGRGRQCRNCRRVLAAETRKARKARAQSSWTPSL